MHIKIFGLFFFLFLAKTGSVGSVLLEIKLVWPNFTKSEHLTCNICTKLLANEKEGATSRDITLQTEKCSYTSSILQQGSKLAVVH